jgi:hypothetical protein
LKIQERLWRLLADRNSSAEERLRAACMLALFDPANPEWQSVRDSIAEQLLREKPLRAGKWAALLRPAGEEIAPALEAIADDPQKSPVQRAVARDIAAEFRGK